MTVHRQATTAPSRRGRPRTGRWLAAAGLALLALAAAPAPAVAQISEAEEESVQRRPRLDLESYGLSLDPVDRGARSTGASPAYAFSRLEVEAGHDSNVRRTATGTTASGFAVTRPGLSLHWDGETHQSAITGQAAIGRYGSSSGDDYEDLELVVRSRVEIDEDLAVALSGEAARLHVERGSDLDLGSGFGTQTYSAYAAGAQFDSTIFPDNPMSATLRSEWYRFDDVDGIDRSTLDRWIGLGNGRIGFARAGEVSFFLQPGVQRVDYTDNGGGNTDSTRLDIAVGATYSGGSVTEVTGFVGGSRRSFDQGGFEPEYSALVGARALWNATDLMTVTGSLSISNEDSELSAASSVTTTELGFGVDYELLEHVILGGEVRWTDLRYQGGVEDERLLEAGLQARYLLNEYAYVGAGVDWEDQSSNDPTNEYQATIGSLRLGVKLCCLRDVVVESRDGRQLRQGVVNGVFR